MSLVNFNFFVQKHWNKQGNCQLRPSIVQVFLKLYVLLYADDTILFSETVEYMQNNAVNATLSYCEVNNMCMNTVKTKYMIFSEAKSGSMLLQLTAKQSSYWILFVIKGLFLDIITLFKLRWSIILTRRKNFCSKLTFFWVKWICKWEQGFISFTAWYSQFCYTVVNCGATRTLNKWKCFTEIFYRRMLELGNSAPKAMVYGEMCRNEIKFTVWKRMINFWKKVTKSPDKLSCVVFRSLHYRNEATQWHLGT